MQKEKAFFRFHFRAKVLSTMSEVRISERNAKFYLSISERKYFFLVDTVMLMDAESNAPDRVGMCS